jgi:hypothetical protein
VERLAVTLHAGRRLPAEASPRGAPQDPFDWFDVSRKTHTLADGSAGTEAVTRFIDSVRSWTKVDEPVRPTIRAGLAARTHSVG